MLKEMWSIHSGAPALMPIPNGTGLSLLRTFSSLMGVSIKFHLSQYSPPPSFADWRIHPGPKGSLELRKKKKIGFDFRPAEFIYF